MLVAEVGGAHQVADRHLDIRRVRRLPGKAHADAALLPPSCAFLQTSGVALAAAAPDGRHRRFLLGRGQQRVRDGLACALLVQSQLCCLAGGKLAARGSSVALGSGRGIRRCSRAQARGTLPHSSVEVSGMEQATAAKVDVHVGDVHVYVRWGPHSRWRQAHDDRRHPGE
jgi:hypothetical protein